MIELSKNVENADTISQTARVSALPYPDIRRTKLTVASRRRCGQAERGWRSADQNRTTCPLPQNSGGVPTFGRKNNNKKGGNQTDLSTEPSVASLCRSSIFPAAAEVQPSERTQFHLTAHVSVINAKTSRNPPIDHRGPTDVQQRWETSRSVWPRSLVNKRRTQLRN